MKLDEDEQMGLSWLKEENRGLFFETPLHFAMLCYRADYEYTKFFVELWDRCPDDVREAQYDSLFDGENVLHIAIVKKVGLEIIQEMVQNNPKLISARATGKFFTDKAESGGGCTYLGEYPLCFAACTNQRDIFQCLLENKADISVSTQDGNNILHLMALNAVNRSPLEHIDSHERSEEYAKDSEASKILSSNKLEQDIEDTFISMYDWIIDYLKEYQKRNHQLGDELKLKIQDLHTKENDDGLTPLTLAAAKGSLSFFNHILNKQISTEWEYGPVSGKRLYLDGIGIPTASERKIRLESIKRGQTKREAPAKMSRESDTNAVRIRDCNSSSKDIKGQGGRGSDSGLTVLQILVKYSRKDILTYTQMNTLLEMKWKQYGIRMFRRKLRNSILFSVIIFLMMVFAKESAWAKVLHCGLRIAACAVYWGDFKFYLGNDLVDKVADDIQQMVTSMRVIFAYKSEAGGADSPCGIRVKAVAMVTWECVCVLVKAVSGLAYGLLVAGVEPKVDMRYFDWERLFVKAVQPCTLLLAAAFLLQLCSPPSVSAAVLSTTQLLYVSVMLMSFANTLYLAMGFETLGRFILLVLRVCVKDLPAFLCSYAIFLLGCCRMCMGVGGG